MLHGLSKLCDVYPDVQLFWNDSLSVEVTTRTFNIVQKFTELQKVTKKYLVMVVKFECIYRFYFRQSTAVVTFICIYVLLFLQLPW